MTLLYIAETTSAVQRLFLNAYFYEVNKDYFSFKCS